MERFAFKIDKALKANLYKICRLCGIDNPEMVPILRDDGAAAANVDLDAEPELSLKIQQCIGFIIAKDDKMPQTMCTLCVDKINDFHEFREMCFATNTQTRKLLGLKAEVPKKYIIADIKSVVDIKDESMVSTALGKKNARKRKLDELTNVFATPAIVDEVKKEDALLTSKRMRLAEPTALQKGKAKMLTPKERRLQEIQKKQAEKKVQLLPKEEIKDEPSEKPAAAAVSSVALAAAASTVSAAVSSNSSTTTLNTSRHKQLCNICDQRFSTKVKLDKHQSTAHMPVIPRFYCSTCDETIKKAVDIKNHQLWHKLSKTPYICALCGESLLSIYAFSRHLREHCPEYPTAGLVLDRQCPQCQQTYATNFLYNTHTCAVRTKKCAGCNRKQSSEATYMTHSANCSKSYLNYSKHIPAAAVAAESCVRIKNENDVEEAAAAEALAHSSGISLDLTPVVSLTRLPSPVVMAVNQCAAIPAGHEALLNQRSSRKGANKKSGVSKKDFKRVDELLKSTIDALVSIKHEPEVHVETDALPPVEAEDDHVDGAASDPSDGEDDAGGAFDNDFHHGDADDADGDNDCVQAALGLFKQEPAVHDIEMYIKKEVIDVDDLDSSTSAATSGKVPTLKLKIKKEHGTLNSSLVDGENARSERKKNKKEKKKRKDKVMDKNQNSQDSITTEQSISENAASAGIIQPCFVRIKQERFDDDGHLIPDDTSNIPNSHEQDKDELMPTQPEATVMTSIPIMQFQIACISSGVEFTGESATTAEEQQVTNEVPLLVAEIEATQIAATVAEREEEEVRDIKPNRMELDRMMQITNITSGADMQEADEEEVHPSTTPQKRKSITAAKKSKKSPTKAMKSTGGIVRTTRQSSREMPTMQILEVRSGADVPPLIIKPEPCNRGYSDEQPQVAPVAVRSDEGMDCDEENYAATELSEFTINEIDEAVVNDDDDEQSYIAKIDFNNLKIKQEKDIEVSEVQLSRTAVSAITVSSCNGVKRSPVKRKTQKRKRKVSSKVEGKIPATNLSNEIDNEELENHHSDEADEDENYDEEFDEDGEEEEDEEELGEEEEEDCVDEAEQEVREYREMDLPPLLLTGEQEQRQTEKIPNQETLAPTVGEVSTSQPCNQMMPTFVITNVRSHAEADVTFGKAMGREISKDHHKLEKQVEQTSFVTDNLKSSEEPVETHVETKPSYASSSADNCNRSRKTIEKKFKENQDNVETQVEKQSTAADNCQLRQNEPDVNTYSWKISSVTASGSDLTFETEFPVEDTKKTVRTETADVSESANICGDINVEKEFTTEAKPFYEPRTTNEAVESEEESNSSDNVYSHNSANVNAISAYDAVRESVADAVEVQQNLLNQEMAAFNPDSGCPITTATAFQLHPYLEDITSSSGSGFSCGDTTEIASTSSAAAAKLLQQHHSEEADNLINESADAALQSRQMRLAALPNHLRLDNAIVDDNSNVNEIAENNNNANIERELLDDNERAPTNRFNANPNTVPHESLLTTSPAVDDPASEK